MKTEVIYVDKKFRKALEADFGVSQSTVSFALNFKHLLRRLVDACRHREYAAPVGSEVQRDFRSRPQYLLQERVPGTARNVHENDLFVILRKCRIKSPVRVVVYRWAKEGFIIKTGKDEWKKLKKS